jgi:hypothetical protein
VRISAQVAFVIVRLTPGNITENFADSKFDQAMRRSQLRYAAWIATRNS